MAAPVADGYVLALEFSMAIRSALSPGDTLANRYRIDSLVGEGGMGVVYRAMDLDLGVPVALKTVRPEIASDPASLRRFKQEVLLARLVSHPNVCRIYDLGRDEAKDTSFLTMEYLRGETLASRIRDGGPLGPEDGLSLVRQLAEALEAAHRAGIVHRDFKSANIVLVPEERGERAVVTDFGLAVAMRAPLTTAQVGAAAEGTGESFRMFGPRGDNAETLPAALRTSQHGILARFPEPQGLLEMPPPFVARSGTSIIGLVGTPAYISPEQVKGDPVGSASDLYALGVVLYEMCTGQLPFPDPDPVATALAHVQREPPLPSTLGAVAPAWERAILRLLSKEPSDRYQSARDVVLALQSGTTGEARTRYSLPAEWDAFVGRETELGAIGARFERLDRDGAAAPRDDILSGARLLTIVGPGGMGKTRLALRYGWNSLADWPGGVWFCDLTEARSTEGIAHAVATGLNVPLAKEDPVSQLGHVVAGRGRCLIILDNFEQVADFAGATLGGWLQRAPNTKFLVTSRERLNLPGEASFELHPLDPGTHGVELFEARARAHRPGFVVNDENRAQVRELVAVLEGIPLAIELAAARLRMLTVTQLRDRLNDRFQSLAGGERGRHAALRTTLDWSWDLLSPWERSAVAQASVFEGGFTLEAAEAVIDLSSWPEAPPVLDVIQSLVNRSWLRTRPALGAPRFVMYVALQLYAAERLGTPGDGPQMSPVREQVEMRHGWYYGAMGTEEMVEGLDRRGDALRREALQLEIDNLVAACRKAVKREDAETAIAAFDAACEVLTFTGPLGVIVDLARLVDRCPMPGPAERARASERLGSALMLVGHRAEARADLEEALAGYRTAGSRRLAGVVTGKLGSLAREDGRHEDAERLLEAALAIHREAGNRRSECNDLSNLGMVYAEQSRREEARRQMDRCLDVSRELGNRRYEALALLRLGILNREEGRLTEAQSLSEAALAIQREIGDRRSQGVALTNLGATHLLQGDLERARRCCDEALGIHRDIGNRRFEGTVRGNLGIISRARGEMDEASCHFEEAIEIYREVGDRRSEGVAWGDLADFHREQGQVDESRRDYETALAISREVGDRRRVGYHLANLGDLDWRQGRLAESRRNQQAALAIAREVGDRLLEGVAFASLGQLDLEDGQLEQAARHLDEGERRLRESGSPVECARLICLRGTLECRRGNLVAARAALTEVEAIAESVGVVDSSLNVDISRLRERLQAALAGDETT